MGESQFICRLWRPVLWVVAILAAGWGPVGTAGAVTFTGLGSVAVGSDSFATAVSSDGRVVVGSSGTTAFRWEAGTMTGLGILPGFTSSSANGVSADGSVVVGTSATSGLGVQTEAFRWEAGTMTGLGFLPGTTDSNAGAVSADGAAVFGGARGLNERILYRWTQSDGMVNLDPADILGGAVIDVRAASADGSAVVGNEVVPGRSFGFRWTASGGAEEISSTLLGPDFNVFVTDISSDGNFIVGGAEFLSLPDPQNHPQAFIWSQATGGVFVGDPVGTTDFSVPNGVSADGSVVVGSSSDAGGAFVWDEINGMQSVRTLLTDAGVDLTGWSLRDVTDVSADGSVIVGNGNNPNGVDEAWIVTGLSFNQQAPAVPEPITATLSLMALTALGAATRRQRVVGCARDEQMMKGEKSWA